MFRVCVPYYPEHWPRTRWDEDARLMRAAGISLVRMGEFAWCRFEPEEGRFATDWMAEAIALFASHGIQTILCTPTATYPAWLRVRHPDLHQQFRNGLTKHTGMRQDVDKCHPGWRALARRITERVAADLGRLDGVVAWQLDNEYGCHDTARSYGPHAERAFRVWLAERYGSITALNTAWGTAFWSQEYQDFSQVCLPRETPTSLDGEGQHPGLVLDFARFSSDVQVRFAREHAALVRAASPGRTITHNVMGTWANEVDYLALAAELDVVGFDWYPHFGARGTAKPEGNLANDFMRSCKRQPYWVLEQTAGSGGWGTIQPQPMPGQIALWAWQSVSRGADLISFFNWRTCRWGREQYWHGVLDHHGHPGRRYHEIAAFSKEFAQVAPVLAGSEVVATAAILMDYDSRWACETQRHTAAGLKLVDHADRWHVALDQHGVTADVLHPRSDLARYAIAIAPCPHVTDAATAAHLEAWVRAGGILIIGLRAGVKDLANAVTEDRLPGVFRALTGTTVEEYDPCDDVPGAGPLRLLDGDSVVGHAGSMAESLAPDAGTQVLLRFGDRFYAGAAAVTMRAHGRGTVVHVGTLPDAQACVWILRRVWAGLGDALPAGIQRSVRRGPQGDVVCWLNPTTTPIAVPTPGGGRDLRSGAAVAATTTIPPLGVLLQHQA
jgi:beta-galactosidase